MEKKATTLTSTTSYSSLASLLKQSRISREASITSHHQVLRHRPSRRARQQAVRRSTTTTTFTTSTFCLLCATTATSTVWRWPPPWPQPPRPRRPRMAFAVSFFFNSSLSFFSNARAMARPHRRRRVPRDGPRKRRTFSSSLVPHLCRRSSSSLHY